MPELDQTQWELGQTPPAAPGAPPLTNPQVTALLNGISTETTRAQGVEASLTASISTLGQQSSANAASIAGEVSRATTAEQGLSAGLTAETIRATAAGDLPWQQYHNAQSAGDQPAEQSDRPDDG